MLKELVNYANWLKKDFEELFEGTLTEGLHIGIKIDKNGESEYEFNYKSKVYNKGDELDDFLLELRKREIISKALGNNKGIIDKVIFSNNPYSIFFKLYFTDSKDKSKILNITEWEEFVNNNKSDGNVENIKENFKSSFIIQRINEIFEDSQNNKKNIIGYYEKILKEYMNNVDDNERNLVFQIKNYVKEKLKYKILNDSNFISMFLNEENGKIKFNKKFFDKEIRVNFLVEDELLKKAANRYFSKMIFVKKDYNKENETKTYGLPSFFNKAAEEKKKFNFHRTSFFKVNTLAPISSAIILNELLNIKENLPNPLPVFIDKNELNAKVIILFKNDKKKGYKEIISEIAKSHKDDLGNYYLLNFTKTKINDLDFVSSFKFYLDSTYEITNLGIFKKVDICGKISNIFDIEDVLDNNFLFKVNRNSGYQSGIFKNNYFTDKIDPGKGNEIPSFTLNNLYKYRKTIYDAIYKSRLYLITPQMIKEFCEPVIYWEILHDETNEKGYSKNEYRIIKKLLYYFVLNKIFDKENKNTGGIDMPSKLPEYYENLKGFLEKTFDLSKTKEITFETDEDFAFGLGQLIRYLLNLSESTNKNHSMLIPFLQKLNNDKLFMKQLGTTFKTYSHRIKMSYWMFDRLMANIMSYKPKKGLQDLEMIILSGYFADSVIEKLINEKYSKKKEENLKEEENE